jgi:predicted 3-demethylubiquinone-9 3-methyltransferase (glyoxalase superfamily)
MDFFWNKLTDGGAPSACGWLKDKFGVSWQVVPKDLRKIMTGDLNKVDNVMKAVMGMTKLDLEKLKSAASR